MIGVADLPDIIIGGETPINNSIVLYHRLKERVPKFIKEIEQKARPTRSLTPSRTDLEY